MRKALRRIRLRARVLFLAFALPAATALPAAAHENDCTTHILQAERELGIPRGLLLAVSLVESGLGGEPQPYALNIDGRTVYAGSVQEAKLEMLDSSGRPKRNVMAGCMQLSVYYHRQAFRQLDKMLEPSANVWYAARYLVKLRDRSGSWSSAVRRYNGGSSTQTLAYLCKVTRHASQLDRRTAALIDPGHCEAGPEPVVAPKTRRAFERQSVDVAIN